jgi:hypothetical protein
MKRAPALALAVCALAASGPSGGGSSHSAPPPPHAAPPPSRPAPPPRPPSPPQYHPAPAPPPGFNLHNDLHPPSPVRPITPPSTTVHQQPVPGPHPPGEPGPGNFPRQPIQQPPLRPRPPKYNNPVYPPNWNNQPSWWWNHNVAWVPAPVYWGGGFWGPYAYGLAFVGFGYYAYDDTQYPSYQVQPATPGAQLLQAYHLTQTPCGPPNLVVIWGPDNSVICAFPNDLVAAGQYQVDSATLTLVSVQPQ